ncbi:hypothetical protein GS528_17150 [Rhodococcus hoagii]|nr:hypothetical protein [Prescottella equi]
MLLLGYATWIATVVFVVGLIFAAGLLWWVYFKGQPATATVQKIAWVTAVRSSSRPRQVSPGSFCSNRIGD